MCVLFVNDTKSVTATRIEKLSGDVTMLTLSPGERAGVRADVITDFICFTPCHPLKTAKNLISLHNFLWTNRFTKHKVKNMKKDRL